MDPEKIKIKVSVMMGMGVYSTSPLDSDYGNLELTETEGNRTKVQ